MIAAPIYTSHDNGKKEKLLDKKFCKIYESK
jgi:hypothetical protein